MKERDLDPAKLRNPRSSLRAKTLVGFLNFAK